MFLESVLYFLAQVDDEYEGCDLMFLESVLYYTADVAGGDAVVI